MGVLKCRGLATASRRLPALGESPAPSALMSALRRDGMLSERRFLPLC
uniref:Uncharacterized protein n=1 Tax=Escherichia coli TaxID=562 RepID=A0A0C5AZY1_ECOLX|nr:hypothetical protein EL78_p6513 [Escherichia coli]